MKRRLTVVLDDEAKTIAVENYGEFSFIELLGISEYLRIAADEGVRKRGAEPPLVENIPATPSGEGGGEV